MKYIIISVFCLLSVTSHSQRKAYWVHGLGGDSGSLGELYNNYKIDNYKNFLTLILDKEEWKIAMSDELKQLQILEFRSFDLTNICVENPNVFWEKYNGIYFNVLNLCLGEDSYNAIPYSVDNNMIYANVSKSENDLYGLPIIRRFYTLFNKKISYNSALSAEYGSAKVDYNLKNLNASDKSKLKLAKLTNPYSLDDPKINFNNIISFRGKLNGIDFRDSQINKKMTFKKCSITEVLNK